MTDLRSEDLIHDWNEPYTKFDTEVMLDDETLRDGLQSPSVRDPKLEQKIELVHLMDQLGIHTADIGLPGAGARAREHISMLVKEMADLSITPNVACRTVIGDIEGRLSRPLLLWRSLIQWLGGMGIVVLFVAVFPNLGAGGKHLFRGEVPGATAEGLRPRIAETSFTIPSTICSPT